MQCLYRLLLFLPIAHVLTLSVQKHHRTEETDNENQAYSILKGLSNGQPFCSSLIYPHGTHTITTTVTVSETATICATKTQVSIDHEKQTLTITDTSVLPQITITEYSKTKLIPSGPTPIINKRNPDAVAAPQAANPTPSALASFSPDILSCACSDLLPCPTTTTTVTDKIPCTTTTTTITTKYKATSTYTLTATPPPITSSGTGTLTTTVPAACAGPRYAASAVPNGTIVDFPQYPDYPRTRVECCVVCWRTKNCVAAAYIGSAEECEFLITSEAQGDGGSKICPKGVFDYPFGEPQNGNVLPGPCGK